jgi:uncharacterized membrane protein YraQ (UPF0718 family)
MTPVADLLSRVLQDVGGTIRADWPYLLASIVAAAALRRYLGTERLERFLSAHRAAAVAGAVLLASLTPFCSCGTTAVVLGMIATRAPWAPIVAFMVASPLTSPSELLLSAGLFGWPYALIFFFGTIVLGLVAGAATSAVEKTGWLEGQARMRLDPEPSCASTCSSQTDSSGDGPSRSQVAVRSQRRVEMRELAAESWRIGRRITAYFLGYTALGYLLIELVPREAMVSLLGGGHWWSVPLAGGVGIPVYITTEASLPMVAGLLHCGLGVGASMAFLVTGAGTSVGAISGALLIARGRVLALVVALLYLGGVGLGLIAPMLL